jgi:hypothetical protein
MALALFKVLDGDITPTPYLTAELLKVKALCRRVSNMGIT